ncbi:hypothetical protein COU74_02310 [Candidatus Peregrinibacteria bacterium CG10_big_fil_rev_8_21_14_0_10_36_19]|nr:MAG: hypothetical protein COU74_02310 [Candidatus Peregrinibacteria bacterium CG10_big_fil_rev_8_21_14_0_10_36_19]
MEIQFFHKNLSEAEGAFFDEYVNQKTDSITSLLTKFASDAVLLTISAEKFEKHDAFEVEFLLKLPAKTLLSKEASHSINKAVDLSRDRLLSQVKKYMAHLRKDRSHKSLRKTEIEAPVEITQ